MWSCLLFLAALKSLSPASREAAWSSLLDEKLLTAQKHHHSSSQSTHLQKLTQPANQQLATAA